MRCASTRKVYHKQADFVIKREQQLKAEKLAASYVDSRSSDFLCHAAKIRGTGKNPSSIVNGISDNKGVANLFTEYFHQICCFRSLRYDTMRFNASSHIPTYFPSTNCCDQ